MSKKRYIDTKFWSDDYITCLDPVEKLLFIYFLTNPHTTIAGIYELNLKLSAVETGLTKETILLILKRFTKDKKIFYYKGYIYITNFIKHQALNPKVEEGIKRELDSIPNEILSKFRIAYHRLSKPTIYSNLNLNSNLNLLATKVAVTPRAEKKKTDIQLVVDHFFALKGWDLKTKASVYSRFTRPAKELLELCEGSVVEANGWLDVLASWAKRTELDWSLSTMIKKWMERQAMAEKKKATFEGNPVVEKNGRFYVIGKDGEKREFAGKKEQLIYI